MLIQTSELKKESFPSINGEGKPIVLTSRDLTNLFCCGDLESHISNLKLGKETKSSYILASKHHNEAVAEFVNRELLAYHRTCRSHKHPGKPKTQSNKEDKEDEVESFGTKRNFKGLKSNSKSKTESTSSLRAQMQRKRDAKRDSKLERMMKQATLTLSHLNQSLAER